VAVKWALGTHVVVTWSLGEVAPAWLWWALGAHLVVTWHLGEVARAWQCGGPLALMWW
jgi:hypothetical protein